MSKKTRDAWWRKQQIRIERQRNGNHHTVSSTPVGDMRAEHLHIREEHEIQAPPLTGLGVGSFPTSDIQRLTNPATAEFQTVADLRRLYIAANYLGLQASVTTLPHAFDDLSDQFGIDVYARMMQDSEVAANLNLLVMASTSQSAVFTPVLNPANPDYAKAVFVAGYFQYMFDTMETSFWEARRALVREGLTYGSAVAELIYDVYECGPYKGFYGVTEMRPLCISDTAFVVDNFNRLIGIVPARAPGLALPIGSTIPLSVAGVTTNPDDLKREIKEIPGILPRHKFWVQTWDGRRSDPRGRSILRPAYTPWWIKQQVLHELLAWLSKYAQPSLWATTPPDAMAMCIIDPQTGQEVEVKPTEILLQALLQLRSASAVAVPAGSEIHTLDLSSSGDIFTKLLAWCDMQITRGILMQHLATGDSTLSGNSNRVSSESHQDVLSLLIVTLRTWQSEALRRDVIIPLTVANFGEGYRHLAPRMDLGEGDGFPVTPMEISQLHFANWFTPDQMAALDRQMGLPIRQTNINPKEVTWDQMVSSGMVTNDQTNSSSATNNG